MPLLTIRINDEDRLFEIPGDKPVFLGRAKECDINLMSPGVSRRHAVIISRGGICGIKDLDSFNGTYLNGIAVTKPSSLRNGDVIRISSFNITFTLTPSELQAEDGADASDASPSSEAKPSDRLRLPRAMTDTATLRSIMGNITTEKKVRQQGEDTCILPAMASSAETILERPREKNEEK